MSNDMDAEWKIDVKKASARPPMVVRDRLRAIIEQMTSTSRRVYTNRGKRILNDTRLPIWQRVLDHGLIKYELDQQHPMFLSLSKAMSSGERQRLGQALQLIAATLPLEPLYADLGNSPELVVPATLSDEALESELNRNLQLMNDLGLDRLSIEHTLAMAEPFRSNRERTVNMVDSWYKEFLAR